MSLLYSSDSSVPEKGQAGEGRHCTGANPSRSVLVWFDPKQRAHFYGGFNFNMSCLSVGSSDESSSRLSSHQQAEDILDKYRNIKRTSPSDGATGGASYDGTGGQERKTALYEAVTHMQ